MKKFLLPYFSDFYFKLFGVQHIICLSITILLVILLYKNRKLIKNIKNIKLIRYILIAVILINMLIYRLSYIYYGVYDIKVHLSLYYCYLINYIFVICLIINYKSFYKIVYILWWIGCFWAIIFPDLQVGIDCFAFYSFFISHNLMIIFILVMMIYNNLKIKFKDLLISMIIAFLIFVLSNIINYDFGTRYNNLNFMFKQSFFRYGITRQFILCALGIFSGIIGCFFYRFVEK